MGFIGYGQKEKNLEPSNPCQPRKRLRQEDATRFEANLIYIVSFRLPRIVAGSFLTGYGKQLRGPWCSLLAKKLLGMQENQSLIPRTQNTKHNQNRILLSKKY